MPYGRVLGMYSLLVTLENVELRSQQYDVSHVCGLYNHFRLLYGSNVAYSDDQGIYLVRAFLKHFDRDTSLASTSLVP